jgi:hypothetical protein
MYPPLVGPSAVRAHAACSASIVYPCGSVFCRARRIPCTQMFPHQDSLSFSPHENAVPEHYHSSSEGSESFALGAQAQGVSRGRDGSADSIGSLAATDEPYLPPRAQAPPPANPSPLQYSVAPEFVPSVSVVLVIESLASTLCYSPATQEPTRTTSRTAMRTTTSTDSPTIPRATRTTTTQPRTAHTSHRAFITHRHSHSRPSVTLHTNNTHNNPLFPLNNLYPTHPSHPPSNETSPHPQSHPPHPLMPVSHRTMLVLIKRYPLSHPLHRNCRLNPRSHLSVCRSLFLPCRRSSIERGHHTHTRTHTLSHPSMTDTTRTILSIGKIPINT